jgi:hypothetical protein
MKIPQTLQRRPVIVVQLPLLLKQRKSINTLVGGLFCYYLGFLRILSVFLIVAESVKLYFIQNSYHDFFNRGVECLNQLN